MIIPTEKLVRYAAIVLIPIGMVTAMRPDLTPVMSAAGAMLALIVLTDAAFVARFPSGISVDSPARSRLTRNVQVVYFVVLVGRHKVHGARLNDVGDDLF